MQISISLNGDQASAAFASPHASVRQALEQAMPHLREMLTSAGISLNDASVSTQLPQQNRDNSQQFTNTPSNRTPFADENAILSGDIKASASLPIQRGRGLVDLFA
jgi:flagellar hook-length control protein FliK